MNTTQRPKFVLVCIAVVLLIFSFAGEMLCSAILETTAQEPRAEDNIAVQQPSKTSNYPTMPTSQVVAFSSFTPMAQNASADQAIAAVALATEMVEDSEWVATDSSSQELNAEVAEVIEVIEASSKPESVRNNHQVTYNLNFVAKNDFLDNVKSTKPATSKSRPSITRMAENKSKVVAIAVSAKPSIYSSLLPTYFNKQAQLKLQQAVRQVNLADKAKNKLKLKLALLDGDPQDLIELEQKDTEPSITEDLIDFLKGLAGYSAKEKIYVLKGLSERKIETLKQILNAHNITLRAFIKA
ncbi:MAG: hypothetical protein P8L98_02740 [Planctomycetota bacterium]|nr:hypothetical protein [Planctomycetota bacterium]